MLIDFKVENFMSIRDEVNFSQIATNDEYKAQHLYNYQNGEKLNLDILPLGIMYGYNAAGKSNILEAIARFKNELMVSTIPEGFRSFSNIKKLDYRPHKLDENCIGKPTRFEIRFIFNECIYKYGYSYTFEKIHDEYFYLYKSNRPTKIFTREGNKIGWNNDMVSIKNTSIIDESLDEETLVLSLSGGNIKLEYMKDAFKWIQQNLIVLGSDTDRLISLEKTVEFLNDEDSSFRELFRSILNESSFDDIKDFQAEKIIETLQADDIPEVIRKKLLENLMDHELSNDDMIHQEINSVKITANIIRRDRDNEKDILFNIIEESEGTIKLFALMGYIYEALQDGKTLIIDEITSKLHPFLARDLTNLFLNKEVNKSGQIIYTTHATELLELLDLRRDEVYIVDKKNGETKLHSVSDIKNVRKDENFRKAYLSGKYGGVPFL